MRQVKIHSIPLSTTRNRYSDLDALDRTRFQDFLHNMFGTTEDIILDRGILVIELLSVRSFLISFQNL